MNDNLFIRFCVYIKPKCQLKNGFTGESEGEDIGAISLRSTMGEGCEQRMMLCSFDNSGLNIDNVIVYHVQLECWATDSRGTDRDISTVELISRKNECFSVDKFA